MGSARYSSLAIKKIYFVSRYNFAKGYQRSTMLDSKFRLSEKRIFYFFNALAGDEIYLDSHAGRNVFER